MVEESVKSQQTDIIQPRFETHVIATPSLVVLILIVVLDGCSTITYNVSDVNFYGEIVLELVAVATNCVAIVVFKIRYNSFFQSED
jgi:hypothetical protein